jgi:hypothetical protein
VTSLRAALGRPARLYACPPGLLEAAATLVGHGAAQRRLTRSLEVDPSETETVLGWRAAMPLEDAVRDLVAGYRSGARP